MQLRIVCILALSSLIVHQTYTFNKWQRSIYMQAIPHYEIS